MVELATSIDWPKACAHNEWMEIEKILRKGGIGYREFENIIGHFSAITWYYD